MEKSELIRYRPGQLQKLKNILSITNKILGINISKLNVIQLEWNRFISSPLADDLNEKVPNLLFKQFRLNELALNYIEQGIKNKVQIDLVIVGDSNRGVNGVSFAKAIKEMKISFSESFPIMLLASQEEVDLIRKSEDGFLFDIYVVRSENYLQQIIDFLQSNISGKSFSI